MIELVQQVLEHASQIQSPLSGDGNVKLHVAYLVNHYPKVSHSFIRREILASESQNLEVQRIALRGWDEPLVDEADIAEQSRTVYILKDGILPLVRAAGATAIRQPREFLRAFRAAVRMSRKSTRPLAYHLVYLTHACRLKQILDAKPVAHLHAHFGTNSAEVAMLLRLLGGPPFSFTVHGADEADDGKYLHLDKKVEYAKFVAAVSAYTRSQLLRHIPPSDWHKVRVVHCGLNAESFVSPAAASETDEPVFLCIGRFSAEKGHLILLDAFSRIAARNPNARLVLAGDGPLRSLIEQRVEERGLQTRVRISGWISGDCVRKEILASRVVVQPSFQEGLPVVLMEAMAQCRPVISTYVAGIPELVVPGEVGWLVPAGDVDALAAAMEESLLLTNEELRRKGMAAYERVRQRHDIAREVKKLRALFAETC